MSQLRISHFQDASQIVEKFCRLGFTQASAATKAKIFARAADALTSAGLDGETEVKALFVPGRVEVLGKHTDYAGGRSLLAATDRGFAMLAAGRDDLKCSVHAALAAESCQFEICPDLAPVAGDWTNYPMTVARRIARNFPTGLRGVDIAFGSDLPIASGMSSSSAFMVATFGAISAVNNLDQRSEYKANIDSAEQLAGYLGTVENGQTFGALAGDKGVGTFGGSQDHTAMLCCQAGRLSQYSFSPVVFERSIELPENFVFAIASSGVAAEKTGSAMDKFNLASASAAEIARIWRDATGRDDPHLGSAIHSSAQAAEKIRELLSDQTLSDRFEHFYNESELIIPAASDALAAGKLDEFGRLVDQSQAGAEQLLGNQIPETIFLARSAREFGAIAASAFGAGFGGSVWSLIPQADADHFMDEWSASYKAQFPDPAQSAAFFTCSPGPAAFEF